MSTSRYREGAAGQALRKGPHGRNLCRWCGSEVRPPRRTFCADECVHQHSLRTSGSYLRGHIFRRDRGLCALCGLDTRKLWRRIRRWPRKRRRQFLLEKGFHANCTHGRSLWEADHIVPVVEGGGQCGLENIRTLCIPCHKEVTARLRGRLQTQRAPQSMLTPLQRRVLARMGSGERLVRNAFTGECRIGTLGPLPEATLNALWQADVIRPVAGSHGFVVYAITPAGTQPFPGRAKTPGPARRSA